MSAQKTKPGCWNRLASGFLTVLIAGLILLGLSRREQIASALRRIVHPAPTASPVLPAAWPTPLATITPSAPPAAAATRTPAPTVTPTSPPTPTPIATPRLYDIRQILELNVIQFKGTTVVEKEVKKWWGRDWVVLMAVGRIRVGIELPPGALPDLAIDGTGIGLVLPHARVTSVELLPAESKIYDSKRNWLLSEYPGLEVEALEAARVALEEAGQKDADILAAAETMAAATLTELFHALGYTRVTVTFTGEDH